MTTARDGNARGVPGYGVFCCTARGARHIASGVECQDYSGVVEAPGALIAAVADGHGARPHFRSAYGAKAAVGAALGCIAEFLAEVTPKDLSTPRLKNDAFNRLCAAITVRWRADVTSHFENTPYTERELSKYGDLISAEYAGGRKFARLYGTTLIAAFITPRFWGAVQIGDGLCFAINGGGRAYSLPVPGDSRCFLNVTTTLCGSRAARDFRYFFQDFSTGARPLAVFLGTDGVDGGFPREDGSAHLFRLYASMCASFARCGLEGGRAEVGAMLPRLSQSGSGDDVSVAGLIDINAARRVLPLYGALESSGGLISGNFPAGFEPPFNRAKPRTAAPRTATPHIGRPRRQRGLCAPCGWARKGGG